MRDFSMGYLGDAAYDSMLAAFALRAVDPAGYARIRPGRPIPDPLTCLIAVVK